MVAGLAFLATAVATVFAQGTLARWSRSRRPHLRAWTVALAMFALASAALATGVATGWDGFVYRSFFVFGAVLNVPWLALGSVYLLAGTTAGRGAEWGLVLFTGIALGAVATAPISGLPLDQSIPVGEEVFDSALPRVLAAIGSGLGALVVVGGAFWSAVRALRPPRHRAEGRLAVANGLIAAGTLVLSGGGLLQGFLGDDEAFAVTLAVGISVIYVGFVVATDRTSSASSRNARRRTLPTKLRGSSETISTTDGTL